MNYAFLALPLPCTIPGEELDYTLGVEAVQPSCTFIPSLGIELIRSRVKYQREASRKGCF